MKSEKPMKPLRDVLKNLLLQKPHKFLKYQERGLLSGVAKRVLKHFHFAIVTALM